MDHDRAYYSPNMRRFAIPGIALVIAAALLALLTFGVAHQGSNTSIDASVARGDYPESAGREEEWMAERLAELENPQGRHEQTLSDGRCILIE